MKRIHFVLQNFIIITLCFCVISLKPFIKVYAQEGSYSTEAQKFLDSYSGDDLDVFKFSINNILNADGDIVEKPAGNPSIFGRTDYGSEFFLENELSTEFSIEIPAFVINDLAEDSSGEYYPIIIDGKEKLSIDFKDLYDTEGGEVITPEMGFVKIIDDATSSDPENLSDGEIVEFFVKPTNKYLNQHNKVNLFFIDRPIPDNPVVKKVDSEDEEPEASSSSDKDKITSIIGPGEEAVTLPSGEVKIYVTNVYVPAPASKFAPTQLVMPVLADGDYNYEIEPAKAETFSDDMQVVAIPEEEAAVLTEKVQELKKAKEAPSNPKHEEDAPPPLDAGLEVMLKLESLLNDVQKAPRKLLSEAKKNIQIEFPNMSNELINLIIETARFDKKFDLLRNPKKVMDDEFAKLSTPQDLELILRSDLSQKEIIKVYNLIKYNFSSELTKIGYETLNNQKIDFSADPISEDQILKQVQLQNDLMPILSLLGTETDGQALASLLNEPIKRNLEASEVLFDSHSTQKVLDQLKDFSEVIGLINSIHSVTPASKTSLNNVIPVIEVNVGIGESIKDALKEKLAKDKSANRNFQSRTQSNRLQSFDFEFQQQNEGLVPQTSPPLLVEAPNITYQELQLVAETTEATNNILNDAINKMLFELGDKPLNEISIQLTSAANEINIIDQENVLPTEEKVFNNALTSVQRLQEIEDIRAIFQILGFGS